jgi:hypothetical protein
MTNAIHDIHVRYTYKKYGEFFFIAMLNYQRLVMVFHIGKFHIGKTKVFLFLEILEKNWNLARTEWTCLADDA